MKIDAQGYEPYILRGALEVLKKIDLVQLEVSFVPLYENEMLVAEMIDYMRSLSFIPVSVEPSSLIPETGQQLQVDVIFERIN